jgi:hypothetical protein
MTKPGCSSTGTALGASGRDSLDGTVGSGGDHNLVLSESAFELGDEVRKLS